MSAEQAAQDLIERFGLPKNREEYTKLLQIAYTRGQHAGMTEGTIMGQRAMHHALDAIGKVLR